MKEAVVILFQGFNDVLVGDELHGSVVILHDGTAKGGRVKLRVQLKLELNELLYKA